MTSSMKDEAAMPAPTSGSFRIIDEAITNGEARTALGDAPEMRALLKPHPAVLYLMAEDRYLEIEIKHLVRIVTAEENEDGWLPSWMGSWLGGLNEEQKAADRRLLRLDLEKEEDLFKGKEKSSVWLAAENEFERGVWTSALKAAVARVAEGWKPPSTWEESEKEKEIDFHERAHAGHDHGHGQGHGHGHGPTKQGQGPAGAIRFAVGTMVLCNTGMWSRGQVVALNYREDSWPEGKTVPYQVDLEEGGLIFAPYDEDMVIRLDDGTTPPPIEVEKVVDDADKTPVTVITGFLGAGKTTLVNYILTSKEHGMRIAIIENEFGAINIDEALVEDNLKTKEDLITMQNGCICCTVRGDLINALQQLAERRHEIDAVIIETTGLADPGPVCVTFKMPQLQNHFRVDGIVCLVDAQHIEKHLQEKREKGTVNESAQQLGFADKILLNKVDLVTRKDIQRIKQTMRQVNGFADVIETNQSKVPLDRILGIDAFNVERAVDINTEVLEPEPECEEDKKCCTSKGCKKKQAKFEEEERERLKKEKSNNGGKNTNRKKNKNKKMVPVTTSAKRHDLSGVGSIGICIEGVISDTKFSNWLSAMLAEEDFALNLYRCKGVLCLDHDLTKKWVFQGVHDNILCKPSKLEWKPSEKKLNKIVFIGRGLDQEKLEKGFRGTLV